MNFKPSVWLCTVCIIFLSLCAGFQKSQAQTTSGMPDVPGVALDRFGKSYSLREISRPEKGTQNQRLLPCNAGVFSIDFLDAPGTGFNDAIYGAAMRSVVCQAFSDLSQLIIPANNPYTGASNVNNSIVNIEIFGASLGTGVLASSSSYYRNDAPMAFKNAIFDGEVYRTINGGIDSWLAESVYYGSSIYHGYILFNFTDFPLNVFHTNLNTANPAGTFDLYQIVLHEAFHNLGFNSFTGATGASLYANYRTRFETFIQSNGNPLLSNITNCFVPALNTSASTTGGCTNTRFVGPASGSLPIYAPNTYEDGSSLSHLDTICPPVLPYVMQVANNPNVIRKPHQDEVNILCDIGYHTTNIYGFAPGSLGNYSNTYSTCGSRLCGVDDIFLFNTGQFYTYINGSPGIVMNDFLSNDEDESAPGGTPSGFSCLTIMQGGGSTINLSATSFSYTPAPGFIGWALLRYYPLDVATGRRGGATYIHINVVNSCPTTPTCNMIIDGNFENLNNPDCSPYSNFRLFPNGNSPDLAIYNGTSWTMPSITNGSDYGFGCGGVIPIPDSHDGFAVNKRYVSMVYSPSTNIEGISLPLCRPLVQGCTYKLSFWGMTKGGCNMNLNIIGTPVALCIPPTITNPTGLNNCDGNTFTPTTIAVQPITNFAPNWQLYNISFVYTGSTAANFLTFYAGGTIYNSIFLDDVSLTSVPTVTVNPVNASCINVCDGSAGATVGCGLTPFTYQWNNGVLANHLEGTCAGTYSVTVTDAAGCSAQSAPATIGAPACGGFTLSKTANHTSTYAGQPVKYTITVCNSGSTAQNVLITDNFPPNFFPITPPSGWPGFPAQATISIAPGCTDFVYYGYFTANGLCPDPDHTNSVEMITSADTLTADFCVSVLYGCPMVTYGNSDCILGNTVPFTLGVHSYILNITRLNTWIYYPEYITPPTTLDASTTAESFPAGNIDFAASSISAPVFSSNIAGVDYYKVLIDIYYTSPVSVHPPNYFLKLNFTYTTQIPACQTSYLCWAEGPVGSTYHVDLYQPGNPDGSPAYTPWTQASHINFVGCDGCDRPDATFTVDKKDCDIDGCVTVTSNNTSPTAIDMWEFGDNRSTPFNGAKIASWCYLDPYTDNFGNTSPGVAPGSYWIIHTVIDNGQVGIDSIEVTIGGPCCTAKVMVPDGAVSSTYGTDFTGIDVEIEGLFTIDNNFSFISCKIITDPASEIVIPDQSSLYIDNTSIAACTNMWKGIRIKGGGVLRTIKSFISDAEYAVYAENKSTFKIGYTDFDNNYVGIYIPPSSLGANSISGVIFGGSFTQFTSFKPFYGGQSPLPGTVSYAGIEINDWTLVMSGSGVNTLFDNINNGIVSHRCNLSIAEAQFEKIYPDPYYGNSFDGSGIYASGVKGNYTLKQTGFGGTMASFRNCSIGIFTENMNVSISSNLMKNVNNGIRDWKATKRSGRIQKNSIDCNYYGIDLRFNDASLGIDVLSNGISLGFNAVTSTKSAAIRSSDYGSSPSKVVINGNKITINDGRFGILCSNSKGIKIISNGIYMQNPAKNAMGISQSVCTKSIIGCNSVGSSGISSTNKNQTAIYTSATPATNIECNTVDQTYNGMRFDGASNSSDVRTNSINKHMYGLYYGTTAVTDAQIDNGNTWNTVCGIADAINIGLPYLSTYDVNPFSPYLPTTIIPSSGWFNNSGNAPAGCTPPTSCSSVIRAIDISKTDITIAIDDPLFPYFTEETNWMADKFLYDKLYNNPSLVNGTALTNFMSKMQGNAIGSLIPVENSLDNLMNDGKAISLPVQQNNTDVANLMRDIEADNVKLQDPNNTPADEANILADIMSVEAKISNLQSILDQILIKNDADHNRSADKAELDNNAVATKHVYDENEKTVNDIYLATVARGIAVFDINQSATLKSIASQCAFEGSEAVYKARDLYSLIDDNASFDDFDICNQNGNQIRLSLPPSAENNSSSPLIIPNPAHGFADVYFDATKDAQRQLNIFDNVGRLVQQLQINPETDKIRIDLNGLSQGIYYVQISSQSKLSARSKLVVVK